MVKKKKRTSIDCFFSDKQKEKWEKIVEEKARMGATSKTEVVVSVMKDLERMKSEIISLKTSNNSYSDMRMQIIKDMVVAQYIENTPLSNTQKKRKLMQDDDYRKSMLNTILGNVFNLPLDSFSRLVFLSNLLSEMKDYMKGKTANFTVDLDGFQDFADYILKKIEEIKKFNIEIQELPENVRNELGLREMNSFNPSMLDYDMEILEEYKQRMKDPKKPKKKGILEILQGGN